MKFQQNQTSKPWNMIAFRAKALMNVVILAIISKIING